MQTKGKFRMSANKEENKECKSVQFDEKTENPSSGLINASDRLALVEKELLDYKNVSEADVDNYLTLLHEYNETRDTAQVNTVQTHV